MKCNSTESVLLSQLEFKGFSQYAIMCLKTTTKLWKLFSCFHCLLRAGLKKLSTQSREDTCWAHEQCNRCPEYQPPRGKYMLRCTVKLAAAWFVGHPFYLHHFKLSKSTVWSNFDNVRVLIKDSCLFIFLLSQCDHKTMAQTLLQHLCYCCYR